MSPARSRRCCGGAAGADGEQSRSSVTVNRLGVAVETPPNSVNLNAAQELECFSVYSSCETDLGPAEYNFIIILSAEQTDTRLESLIRSQNPV